MTAADILLALLIVAFIGWIMLEFHRAPTEEFDRSDYEADAAAAEEIIAASRPAELRPHARAFTEPRI
jgi:hypothetical protein